MCWRSSLFTGISFFSFLKIFAICFSCSTISHLKYSHTNVSHFYCSWEWRSCWHIDFHLYRVIWSVLVELGHQLFDCFAVSFWHGMLKRYSVSRNWRPIFWAKNWRKYIIICSVFFLPTHVEMHSSKMHFHSVLFWFLF